MQPEQIFEVLVATFGDAAFGFTPADAATKDAFLRVQAPRLRVVVQALRDHPALAFDFLENVTAIDWPKTATIDVVYHLFSYPHRHGLVLKVTVPRDEPRVPSLTSLYRGADWLEREQYDLMGVVFEGHPDLRRLLLPEDWEGHPLRKDYVQAPEYRGMRTTRPSPLDLVAAFDKHAAATPAGSPEKVPR